MSKQVISSKMYFVGGRRVRPGEVFAVTTVTPDMTVVEGPILSSKPVTKAPGKSSGKGAKSEPVVAKDPETFSEIAKNEPAGADLV